MNIDKKVVADLTEAMNQAPDTDWFQAVLGHAIDKHKGDLKAALAEAKQVIAAHPHPPAATLAKD